MLPPLTKALGITIEELLEETPKAAKAKRGPASVLERQIEQISHLPRAKQKFVMEMLEAVLQQAS